MANEDDDKPGQGGRQRERSPNYPIVGFKSALEVARKIYLAEKRHPMAPPIAAKHMGYTLNGRSKSLIATLKKYGLLEATPEGVRVTDDAVAMFHFPTSSVEYQERAGKLPLRPEIFREVYDQFAGSLPSNDNLRARLVHDRKFTPDAADVFIEALRESIDFMPSRALDPAPSVVDTFKQESTGENTMTPTNLPAASPPTGRLPAAASPTTGGTVPAPYRFPLGAGVDVEVRFSGAVSKKQLSMLKKQIDLLADALDETEQEGKPM